MKLKNIFALLGVATVVTSCAPKAAPDPLTEALNVGELTVADIDCINFLCTVLQHTIGKTAR